MAKNKNKKQKQEQEQKQGQKPPKINVISGKMVAGANAANINKWLALAVFLALGVLIFYPPYVRGLFFKENIFVYHILTALVFAFVWFEKIRRKDYSLMRTPLDWAVLAYALAYLLSLIGAVHPGEALYGFLRALNLFMVYWMVAQVVKDYRGYEKILQILLASGVGVAVIGILAATGYSQYPGALQGNAISSTLQYTNSAAAFLAVMTLIGITLWVRAENIGRKLVYGLACFIMLLAVLGALSKGAWLILAAGALLLLIGLPGVYRFRAVFYLGVAAGAAALTASRFLPAVSGEDPAAGLGLLWLGVIVVIAGQAIAEVITFAYRKQRLLTIGAVLILFIGVACLQPIKADKLTDVTPGLITTELKGILDTEGASYQSRMDFNRWGIAIVKDHPVTGTGAGGWNALYHQYQDYLMYTTETHNHFLQVWVEAGTLGFIAFIAMWIMMLVAVFRLYRRNREGTGTDDDKTLKENWVLNWGVASAALAFGMHAAIDFDLSLLSLALVLWVLLGLINAALRMELGTDLRWQFKPAVNISLAAVFALLLVYFGGSFTAAFNNAQAAGVAMQQIAESTDPAEQNRLLTEAGQHYGRAVATDSGNGMYHANLALFYAICCQQSREADQQLGQEYYQQAVRQIQEAERLSYYDIKVRNFLLESCNRLGDMNLLVSQAEATLEITPFDINCYISYAGILWAGTEAYINATDYEGAGKLARELVGLEEKMRQQRERVNQGYWQGAPLQLNAQMQLDIGRAAYLLGDYDRAIAMLEPLAGEPDNLIWLAAALYKAGDGGKAGQLTAGLEQSDAALYGRYQQILEMPVLK